ncbi:ferredoxin reductase [Gordonia sp. (in: high G+C Gram-positive bacteria)]|uniref:ferredoxin reductase n=1 Tax=Gordonia sp. (in: high G+C Gram-positive bacteria) TaxID=84139 RepID=UPI00169EEFE1|nr:ferredoxin reductase [Gordonia sp. (in: high G+C Gram-positive bacteria)]NLG46631.1 ferredoxin reductase [Gordonia sp. (in: high G+C Gram-positive bacteria)]
MAWRERFEAPAAGVAANRKRAKWLRAAVARVTTPLLPDDYLHLANPLWSARELRGKVVAVTPETSDSATIVIRPGWGFSFDYHPGQYIGIGVLVEGRWTWRSYSLTSEPASSRSDRTVSITVKAMPEGFLSSHLVNGLEPGSVVRLAAPAGEFVLPEPLPEKILFATAGSGLTPIISMLRTMRRRGQHVDVKVLHSVPTEDDLMFGDELQSMADEGLIDIHVQFTRVDGKLTPAQLRALCPDWAERATWACGPGGFLDMLSEQFEEAGVPEKLHIERFALERGAVGAEGGVVTFGTPDRQIEVDGATTLLEAGEEAGVLMPFGCRMGICQSCVVMLDKGVVRDLRTGVEHVEGERIQTCVSAAAGDCTLDV